MSPLDRIPSSIRVRRAESDQFRPPFYSSADTYTNQINDTASSSRYPNGVSQTGSQLAGNENENAPHEKAEAGEEEEQNDDAYLRQEMRAARRAIYDQEQRERKGGSSRGHSMDGDEPPIRLSDESRSPRAPPRSSSRRMGAVENLALRHRQLHRSERRRKRSQGQTSSSATSESAESEPEHQPSADVWARRGSAGSALHPQPQRILSNVEEEARSFRTAGTSAPQSVDTNPKITTSYFGETGEQSSAAPVESVDREQTSPENRSPLPRGRRSTIAEDGLMATSRQFLGNMLRRNSDRQVPTNNSQSPEGSRQNRNGANDDRETDSDGSTDDTEMHEDEVVDYLDVVDPEIATVTALQNVGNSIFFPPIPMLYNRRPTISLPASAQRRGSRTTVITPSAERRAEDIEMGLPGEADDGTAEGTKADSSTRPAFSSLRRMASLVPGRRKKQIPETSEEEKRKHIQEWAQMDEEERNELDEHVGMLLTKKAKFKRGAKGFWRYVKTPHGLIITLYAISITFWGTAICLFLLRWINLHNPARQRYWIEICDQILCALFAAVGLGFAPFRAVDTYRMVQIAHYHFLTYKRRRQLNLPDLKDKNELPRASPRVNVAQMANNMMIKTGLRKDPGLTDANGAESGGDVGSSTQTDSSGSGAPGAATNPGTNGSSMELLELQTSRRSEEVEMLKEQKSRKSHDLLHRKHKKDGKKEGAKKEPSKEKGHKKASSAVPKTYANKDGIMPLGQLKRNPSIASELPRDAEDVVVLSPKQQANLEYQQRKFHQSHTFYRYRETVTHRPFELSLMMAIVILLDCHSCLQASLGGTTWGIYYKNRPTSVTATIITFSLSCNAVAGFLIWYGGSRTKKKDEVERLLRIALEEEALRKIQKKHEKERLHRFELRQQRMKQERGNVDDISDNENKNETGQEPKREPVQQPPDLECIEEH